MTLGLAALPEVGIAHHDSAGTALTHREGAEVGEIASGLVNQKAKSAWDRGEE